MNSWKPSATELRSSIGGQLGRAGSQLETPASLKRRFASKASVWRFTHPRRWEKRQLIGSRRLGRPLLVWPVALDELPIAALGLASTCGDDLEAAGAGLEAAGHTGGDPDHIPLLDLDDLVVQLDPARAGDDRVDLLLDPVTMPAGLLPGLVSPAAHPELSGVQKLARETAVDPVGTGGLDVLEVLDLVAGGHATKLLMPGARPDGFAIRSRRRAAAPRNRSGLRPSLIVERPGRRWTSLGQEVEPLDCVPD